MVEKERIYKAYWDDSKQSLLAPMASIAVCIEGLQAQAEFIADGELRRDLQRIGRAQSEILTLLDSVTGFSSAEEVSLARLRHDLRNAVGLIDGYGEMLHEDLEAPDSIAFLEKIHQHSMLFQERLEAFTLPDEQAASIDPITDIFKSFKSGIVRDSSDHPAANILVVDDNESSRELLAEQLQRQGYTVIEAESGQRCLEIMRSVEPDLLLLDLLMPDMNGYQVLQALREDQTLQRIPVIVVSGMQDQEGAIRCIDAGASDYLLKPLNATLLSARVEASLESKFLRDREREYLFELEKSQRFIRKVFGRYLSDEIVQQLLDDNDGLDMGGELRTVTILMADIRGFSEISRQLEPKRCMQLLNNYLAEMTAVIQGFAGTVDEFVGDAILAIFGAPITADDDCDRALACALEMQNAMQRVNDKNLAENLPPLDMGIALNTGEVVAGNIGSELRSKYGIVGHNVNLTARIESCTVGGQILMSPSTVAATNLDLLCGKSLEVLVKGHVNTLRLSELRGVGMPYNLLLIRTEDDWIEQRDTLLLKIGSLSDKQLGPAFDAELVAVTPTAVRLRCSETLPMVADVYIQLTTAASCSYGKTIERENDIYEIALTSIDESLAKVLDTITAA